MDGVIVKNLLPGDCKSPVQSVYLVSEPTIRELSALMEPFFYGFRTFLQGSVCRECSLFYLSKPKSRRLSAGGSCFFMVSKPSSRGLPARGFRLFIRLITYFQGSKSGVRYVYKFSELTLMKLRLCRAFVYGFQTYLQGTVDRECSLNVFVQNLHTEYFCLVCVLFYGFQTFLQGTFGCGL